MCVFPPFSFFVRFLVVPLFYPFLFFCVFSSLLCCSFQWSGRWRGRRRKWDHSGKVKTTSSARDLPSHVLFLLFFETVASFDPKRLAACTRPSATRVLCAPCVASVASTSVRRKQTSCNFQVDCHFTFLVCPFVLAIGTSFVPSLSLFLSLEGPPRHLHQHKKRRVRRTEATKNNSRNKGQQKPQATTNAQAPDHTKEHHSIWPKPPIQLLQPWLGCRVVRSPLHPPNSMDRLTSQCFCSSQCTN